MTKIKIVFLVFLLFSSIRTSAQSVREPAFSGCESLEYLVSYKAKLVPHSDVAKAVITTTETRFAGHDAFHIKANGRVMPFFRWFFDINDSFSTWLDKSSLRPLKFTTELREGTYRFSSSVVYNWGSMTADSKYRNLKRPNAKTKTLTLKHKSYDALALLYNLRCEDANSMVVGGSRTLHVVLEDTVRSVEYKFLGREEISVKNLGRFKTLKFSCQLRTSSGESFEDGAEFFVWISDDQNKIPLYVESPVRVGSISGRLSNFSGLKYPLDSKIP